MSEMTSHERFKRTFEHREADRVPIVAGPLPATLARWRREGFLDVDWAAFLGIDRTAHVACDNSPRYPEKVIEETDDHVVRATRWGARVRERRDGGGEPEPLDFTVTDPQDWRHARARMTPTLDRIDWGLLRVHYGRWREEGRWITAGMEFGFGVAHERIVGTGRMMAALMNQPDWCVDMFNHCLDVGVALIEMMWDQGYTFDALSWTDDLCYRGAQLMSADMYQELLKPVHQRACRWAHTRGVRTILRSSGDAGPFVADFVDAGIDALAPLEAGAGMDPLAVKKAYGDRLVLSGGLSAGLLDKPGEAEAEMRRIIPVLKERGGYVFSPDGGVPPAVGLEDFRRIVELARQLGAY